VIGIDQVIYWKQKTSKPFGILGVTLSGIGDKLKEVLKEAAFIFTRETTSLTRLRTENIVGPVTGFAPDSTFAIQLADEKKAKDFLSNFQLEEKEFICIVPRLRYTPYHEIYPDIGWSDEKIKAVTETNDRHKEEDHAKIRELIIWWVSETGNQVLLCPEMTYQVNIMDSLILNPLPAEIRKNVIKHDYWLPDEAASVYKKAHSVISMECHSPIIAAANGTPCFYLRQPQDTIKGQMWYDLGLYDWVFEIEDTAGQDIIRQLNQVFKNYSDALNYLKNAMNKVSELYDGAFEKVQQIVYPVT
jgi:polysaccharide pyruvyl transferase WcaK-like protein